MKKLKLILWAAAAFVAMDAGAREKSEVYLSAGAYPCEVVSDFIANGFARWDLSSGYQKRFNYSGYGPVVGLEYQHFVSDKVKIGGICSWLYTSGDYYDPAFERNTSRRINNYVYLMAQARYCYQHTDRWQVYLGGGAGASLCAEYMEGDNMSFKPKFAFEVIPLGIANSSVVPVYLDLVMGNTVLGLRMGIGFKL